MPIKIFITSNWWSILKLRKETETIIAKKQEEGWELINVSFGTDVWYKPTSFIVMKKKIILR